MIPGATHCRFCSASLELTVIDLGKSPLCESFLAPDQLVQALLIRYDPGAGIGWHKDRPVFEHVIGISLGHGATLRLRQRTADGFARAKAELAPRSIYHLAGEVRHQWEHSIAPMEVPRWSITFRSLRDGDAP